MDLLAGSIIIKNFALHLLLRLYCEHRNISMKYTKIFFVKVFFVKIPTYHLILFPIFYWCTQQTLYMLTYTFCTVSLLNKTKHNS